MKNFRIIAGFLILLLAASFIWPGSAKQNSTKPVNEKCNSTCQLPAEEQDNGQELLQNHLYRQFL